VLYFLFFCSGLSGLIYQVVWVREFGNVFGNTIYSASLVVSVFMLGLGAGGFLVGGWADRRYAIAPASLLRTYGYFELAIAAMGLAISVTLPQLGRVSAVISVYTREASGWYVPSVWSYVARGATAIVLLTPIAVLMGGTLTLLVRHLVRKEVALAGWRVAALYGVNTFGAACGCFLTDFALVPSVGFRGAQIVAVIFNVVAAVGALWLGSRAASTVRLKADTTYAASTVRLKADTTYGASTVRLKTDTRYQAKAIATRESKPIATRESKPIATHESKPIATHGSFVVSASRRTVSERHLLLATSVALGLSGFAAMGMEILWFRHFTLLLGGFRAVFSLLLTVILVGMGLGALVGGAVDRRTTRPADWLIAAQGLFVAFVLAGVGTADVRDVLAAGAAAAGTLTTESGLAKAVAELWLDVRPILIEVGVPAFLMGCSFPLANAIVQRAEPSVGRYAGVLYLANTVGAVCGSLATGFVLLPGLGIQGSATVLTAAAAVAVVPLYLATALGADNRLHSHAASSESRLSAEAPSRRERAKAEAGHHGPALVAQGSAKAAAGNRRSQKTLGHQSPALSPVIPLAGSLVMSGAALWIWLTLPAGHVITHAMAPLKADERLLTLSEGVTEIIAVTEAPGRGRGLITNGHPMSSTALLDQRYMRALAHIPLLSMERPARVLVIGFGAGNSTHAATLHPSVERVEVADLSRHVLEHAGYFRDANDGVLEDRRVKVYVNDGRQHLQMQPQGVYDLITLEPPPITHAGVAALYSREFYALARTRLKPGGFLTQWLPAYQASAETTLAMIRAFIDVFPQSVLLSGMQTELLLVGTSGARIEIDPERLAHALERAPAVRADLRRLDLGTVTEIVGTFVGSAETLARATRTSAAVSDDRPLQEYGVHSVIGSGPQGIPASIVDLSAVEAWCPRCFDGDRPTPAAAGLDTYLALLDQAYHSPVAAVAAAAGAPAQRRMLGSLYLGGIVPDTDAVHNVIGVQLLREGRYGEAADAFREALKRRADSVDANRNLGTALAESGRTAEAIGPLRRAVQLDPSNGGAQHELGSVLLEHGEFAEAADHFRAALRVMPNSAGAHNDLGTALASMGQLGQAIEQFKQAVGLEPEFDEARRNLTSATQARRRSGS
jgi:spermidine synthase